MKIYHYDQDGAFVGDGTADLDPMEPGRYATPYMATTSAPPASGANQVPVFDGTKWNLQADFRGAAYWTADGSRHEIRNLGETIPADAYRDPADIPAPPEADRRAAWRVGNPSVTRTAFIMAAKRAGVISSADAIVAAKGDWPESFSDILPALPPDIDPVEAQIVWAATDRVYRLDPVLIAIGAHLNLSDEYLDGLLGWAG